MSMIDDDILSYPGLVALRYATHPHMQLYRIGYENNIIYIID